MNKLHLLFLWLLVACSGVLSCNKPLPNYGNRPFDYTISGIRDTTVPANGYIILTPGVNLVSGDASVNPITLSFKGLPQNVFTDKNNYTFKLNTTLSDSFGAHNATQGVYPIQAVFSSPAGTKTENFYLTVGPPVNRTANVLGYFYTTGSCWDLIYVSCQIDSIPGSPGQLMIIDRTSPNEMSYGTFDTTFATVDCCSNTFTIPTQKVNGVTVSGSGYVKFDGYRYYSGSITRTFITDSTTYNCTVGLYTN